MTVSEYAIRFSELSCHAPALVSTVREQVRRFIEGLSYGLRFSMARELETDTPLHQVVEIAWRMDRTGVQEREDKVSKRPRDSGEFSGARASISARNDRGYVRCRVHSPLLATRSASSILRSQVSHYAQPLFRAPPARGAFIYQSSRLGQIQF
ncbi:uncharacterized protein [Nicotiana tomentosiformis]|uniref:uncharacterized protein n=1 Tax=Nicotiana tomentosiformis TaxID=4098 RepID=UPI00388CD799